MRIRWGSVRKTPLRGWRDAESHGFSRIARTYPDRSCGGRTRTSGHRIDNSTFVSGHTRISPIGSRLVSERGGGRTRPTRAPGESARHGASATRSRLCFDMRGLSATAPDFAMWILVRFYLGHKFLQHRRRVVLLPDQVKREPDIHIYYGEQNNALRAVPAYGFG